MPRLPEGGDRLDCGYVSELKVECSLTCRALEGERISYCYLYQGEWRGELACSEGPVKPLERLASCVHRRQTGCLLPARLADSGVECGVRREETWCRVTCGPGLVSPADWASCLQDTSGWVARWSRLLLPCIPDCHSSQPSIQSGSLTCLDQGQASLRCEVSCDPGHRPRGLNTGTAATITCTRGVWSSLVHCVQGL